MESSGIIHSDEKLSNRAKRRGTSQNGKVIIIKHLHFRLLSKNFRKIAMYRLNSLNADIQLIVDGAWESRMTKTTLNNLEQLLESLSF